MFINKDYIERLLEESKKATKEQIQEVLEKAKRKDGLKHRDIAILLQIEDKEQIKEMYEIAGKIKKDIYGKRIVIIV